MAGPWRGCLAVIVLSTTCDFGRSQATFPSCTGICENATAFRTATDGSNAVCFCDESCVRLNLCCPDYNSVCASTSGITIPPTVASAAPTMAPSAAVTCRGKCNTSLSSITPSGTRCYCDTNCVGQNNCCSDYSTVCTPAPTSQPTATPAITCAGNCNATFSAVTPSGRCYCDATCIGDSTCCPDYVAVCATPPPPTSAMPTVAPSHSPTLPPTMSPTEQPTISPSATPTDMPTQSPTTVAPTAMPSAAPSSAPTMVPTATPTAAPTLAPTSAPTTVTTTTRTATTTTRTVARFIQVFVSSTPFTSIAPTNDPVVAARNIARFKFAFYQRLHQLAVAQSLLASELDVATNDGGYLSVRAAFTNPSEQVAATNLGIQCQVNFAFGQLQVFFAVNAMTIGSCDPSTTATTVTFTSTTRTATITSTSTVSTTTASTTTGTSTTLTDTTLTSTTTTLTNSPTRSPTMPPTVSPTAAPSAQPTRQPTGDICRVHTCALYCTGSCGWRLPSDPRDRSLGVCVTGEVTERHERLLGCSGDEIRDLIGPVTSDDGDGNEEAATYWIAGASVMAGLVFILIVYVVYQRKQRQRSSYNVSKTVVGPARPLPNEAPKPAKTEEEMIRIDAQKAYAAITEEARLREADGSSAPASPTSPTITLAPPPKRTRPTQAALAHHENPPSDLDMGATGGGSADAAGSVPTGDEEPRWFHGAIDRETAEARIQRTGIVNGRFLVRKRDPTVDEFVMAIGYKGRVTHHLVKRDDDGLLIVHKKSHFGRYETIEQMVQTLSVFESLPDGWPIRLAEGVDKDTGEFFEMDAIPARVEEPEAPGPQSAAMTFESPPPESHHHEQPTEPAADSQEQDSHETESPATEDARQEANTEAETDVPQHVAEEQQAPPPLTEAPQLDNEDELPTFKEGMWVHDQGETMSKADGQAWAKENLKEKDGSLKDGTFALRRHKTENAYVMELVYKQRMTSHLIEVEPDVGVITIGKKQYGQSTTFDQLIDALATDPLPTTRQGRPWPVRLVQGLDPDTMQIVPVPVGNSSAPPAASAAAPAPKASKSPVEVALPAQEAPKEAAKASTPAPAPSNAGSDRVWFHGISKGKEEDAAKLRDPKTKKCKDGHFFVCEVDAESSSYPAFVLNIVYRGKPTRHLVKDYGQGFKVNKKSYGSFATIDEVVQTLSQSQLPQGWPVRLTHTIDETSGKIVKVAQDVAEPSKPSQPQAVTIDIGGGAPPPQKKAPVTIEFGSSAPKPAGNNPSWYQPLVNGNELTREEAVSKIEDSSGSFRNGRFIIREHIVDDGAKPEWVLTVAYRGKPTHHKIMHGPDGNLLINKKSYGGSWSSVHELVATLSGPNPPSAWPVPLIVES